MLKYTLKIAITTSDQEILNIYNNRVNEHNNKVVGEYPDSGFDLLFVENRILESAIVNGNSCELIDMFIKCEMINNNNQKSVGFYVYPRSSMSKTPVMLGNHVGIIDSGYRGSIKVGLRNLMQNERVKLERLTRLVQICAPDLSAFNVIIVDESELSNTERGDGGFGSTGK
tara:strand:+ start:567 stop:1079 length:513 start_codon:yes stop_codon:yes gene_type:complete